MTIDRPTAPDAGDDRRAILRAMVERDGFVAIRTLADALDVSVVTIRSDLDALAGSGVLRRVRGGALSTLAPAVERPFEEVLASHAEEKAAIARAAAAMVSSGQSVVLDVGTTTSAIAAALIDREDLEDVTIITNGLTIALELERAVPRFTVVVSGGTLRPLQHSLVEPLAADMFSRIRADLAFLGCTGIEALAGVTNVNLPESVLKRAMVAAAARAVVVADSSKLGVVHLGLVAPISGIAALVTGEPGDDRGRASIDALESAGLAVVRASA